MSFPGEMQGSIRAQLADCLVGVVCQRLLQAPVFASDSKADGRIEISHIEEDLEALARNSSKG